MSRNIKKAVSPAKYNKENGCNNQAGSGNENVPRLVGEILHDFLEKSNEPLAVACREQSASGWKRNTDLCMDVKTFLQTDRRTKIGKDYPGVLRRDTDDHYTFVEILPFIQVDVKRNPRVFDGKYITVTRRDDGTLRPNFKPMVTGKGFSVVVYAVGVMNELRRALSGLLEKEIRKE